jgi:transcriptional regulator
MLVPSHFRPRDERVAWEVMDRHGFATVVVADPDGVPHAAELPVLARPERRELVGHLARANPMVELMARPGATLLVAFHGPSGYVTPRWYGQEPSVPTWNHVTVHVTGPVALHHDHATALEVLRATVEHFERDAAAPWALDTQSPYVRDLARGVMPFTVAVTRVQAIAKLSQNVDAHLQDRVVAGFEAEGNADLVAAMRAELSGTRPAGR